MYHSRNIFMSRI